MSRNFQSVSVSLSHRKSAGELILNRDCFGCEHTLEQIPKLPDKSLLGCQLQYSHSKPTLCRLLPGLRPLVPVVAERPARGRARGRRRPARASPWKGGRPASEPVATTVVDNTPATRRRPTGEADRDAPPPAPPRAVRLAAAGLALDRGPRAMALRDLRADRLWLGRRGADELQAGADGGEVVARVPPPKVRQQRKPL